MSGQVKTIHCPATYRLTGDANRALMVELRSTVDACAITDNAAGERLAAVIVMFDASQCDPDQDKTSWLRDVGRNAVLVDLTQRLMNWRGLLRDIVRSPVPWIFVANGGVIHEAWELALACKRRLIFAAEGQVGFPDIRRQYFPPGGMFERQVGQLGRPREWFETHATLSVVDAAKEGFIDATEFMSHWKEVAVDWVNDLIDDERSDKGAAKAIIKGSSATGATAAPAGKLTFVDVLKQYYDWVDGLKPEMRGVPAYEYAWHVLKSKDRFSSQGEADEMLCFLAASRMLQSDFQVRLLRAELAQQFEPQLLNRLPMRGVIFDMGELIPPVSALARLLRLDFGVQLMGPNAQELSSSLTLLMGRLDRHFSPAQAKQFWDDQIAWSLGEVAQNEVPTLRYDNEDHQFVTTTQGELCVVRLSGNQVGAELGWGEWTGKGDAQSPQDARWAIVRALAEGIIRTRGVGASQIPVSAALRVLVFEEILRLSRFRKGQLESVVESLRTLGWGFAGDESAWDRFLHIKEVHYSDSLDIPGLFREKHQFEWPIASWAQARQFMQRGQAENVRWNHTAISQHIALWVTIIMQRLVQSGSVTSVHDGDILACAALGFPKALGTPSVFAHEFGNGRLHQYMQVRWPDLNRGDLLV